MKHYSTTPTYGGAWLTLCGKREQATNVTCLADRVTCPECQRAGTVAPSVENSPFPLKSLAKR